MSSEPATAASDVSIKLDQKKAIFLPTAILSVAAAPDGRTGYAACLDGGVYSVDLENEHREQLTRHESYASGVRLLPRAQVLVSAGYDGALHWYDLAAKSLVRRVAAHKFWSWKLAVSPDEAYVASVTGQYLAGSIKYDPAGEREPSIRVYDAASGEQRQAFHLRPPVLSCAFSPDSRLLAAANMMGDVRVWDVASGEPRAEWNTPDFTSWGIVKSHHYVGGVCALSFNSNGEGLLLGGMGPMNDPMAGNGKQTWQHYAWSETPPRKIDQIHEGDHGNGPVETLTLHPSGRYFLLAGKLAQGKWNVGAFETGSGRLVASYDAKTRIADAAFAGEGQRLLLGGAVGQERRKNGECPPFGRLLVLATGERGA